MWFDKVFAPDPMINDRAAWILVGIAVLDIVLSLLLFTFLAFVATVISAYLGEDFPEVANPWPSIGCFVFVSVFTVSVFNMMLSYVVLLFVQSNISQIVFKRATHIGIWMFGVLMGLYGLGRLFA